MTLKFLDKLSRDFSELLNDKEEYNVVIEVGQEQYKKTFTAHSAVLRYRSSYFSKELTNTVPNDENNKIIIKPFISVQIFEILLKYVYGGIIDTKNMDARTMYDLMIVANELEFGELSRKLENNLIESKAFWLRTHFTFVYHSIFKRNKFQNLEKFCNDIIIKHPSIIFESAEFISLHESALVSILRRDDLHMKESEIWDYVIKWGTAQNPTLPKKLKEWSDENFMTLKATLQQCLPLVRYFHISNSDVMDKIKPYKKILGKQLWNDLKQHLILPDRPIKSTILPPRLVLKQELPARAIELFSTIINEEHASMIVSWIDNRPTSYSSRDNPYEFQLIFRGKSEIWDYVIKWGTAQNPTLPKKLKEWSDENFMTLKATLQQCLPLVRYFHISNSDVMDKIKPYKKILGKQLWNDLKQHLILPDRPIKSTILPPRLVLKQELPARAIELFSTIINEEHASMIVSWIDNRPTSYSSRDNPYEFQLIFRGSKDGFAPRNFWNICDGHSNTIVVTKVKGTNEILGGFNPLAWDKTKEGWMKTDESFIFSFKDVNIHNPIRSRVENEDHALWYPLDKDRYGPYFGDCEFMIKLSVLNFTQNTESFCRNTSNYEKPIRKTEDRFSIIDYESSKSNYNENFEKELGELRKSTSVLIGLDDNCWIVIWFIEVDKCYRFFNYISQVDFTISTQVSSKNFLKYAIKIRLVELNNNHQLFHNFSVIDGIINYTFLEWFDVYFSRELHGLMDFTISTQVSSKNFLKYAIKIRLVELNNNHQLFRQCQLSHSIVSYTVNHTSEVCQGIDLLLLRNHNPVQPRKGEIFTCLSKDFPLSKRTVKSFLNKKDQQ
ncbi:hypothetical protein Glove_13g291 [Diversispora epigaea]|uniref:BTB domain-containing protein n=1 Tax=Diversispora epigaea TaxID=1348612 RepID=A0A397JXS5_9GLOM|nr:hypothetical protein Glove_13g291 [Diversispora epigaea]